MSEDFDGSLWAGDWDSASPEAPKPLALAAPPPVDKFTDEAAECAVLAMIHLGKDLAATEVKPEDFTDTRRAAIWRAALDLEAAGRPIDPVTLEGRLGELHPGLVTMEQIGESADALGFATAKNAHDYVSRVIGTARRRNLRDVMRAAGSDAEADAEVAGPDTIAKIQNVLTGRGGPLGVTARDGIVGAVKSITERKGDKYGLETGFARLDHALGGLGPGEIMVLSGVTGTGKTAYAIQIADYLATHPKSPSPVLYFSGEMLASDLWLRILCTRGKVSLADLRRQPLESDMRGLINAAKTADASRLIVSDSGMELQSIESKIRRFGAENPDGLVIIDHLDHVEADAESQVQAIAKIMRRIKAASLASRLPIIVVAQFNRGYDGVRKPAYHDLKGGSAIEQYSDSIWLLWTPYPDNPHVLKMVIDKNRRGPRDEWFMEFTARHTSFRERQ
jgi:replicative DNA helicase